MFRRLLGVFSLLVGCVAIARLIDAVSKRQLVLVARELSAEQAALERKEDLLLAQRERLEADRLLLEHRLAMMSKREHYVVVLRGQRRIRLGLEDKVLFEAPLRVRGPAEAVEAFMEMPRTTYQVLARRTETSWYKPDWLFRLEGVEPPADSAARTVPAAMGPVAVYLGGGLAIHGPVCDDVPPEAIDYTYVELDSTSLKSVTGSLKEGSPVYIQ